jgi:aminomethyltransferase
MTNTVQAPYKNAYKYDKMKRTQHMAVRNTVGWYCFTHQLVEVSGPDAATTLDSLYTADVKNMKAGKNRYAFMLNDKGEIIDDVILIRQSEDTFWISNLNLFLVLGAFGKAKAVGAKIEAKPITSAYDMYAVQGPKSKELINALTEKPVDDLKFFTMEGNAIDGIPVKINRAGFTGEEHGYEIYVNPSQADIVVQKLREVGPSVDAVELTEIQTFCWTLPAEKGLMLIRDLVDLTPFDVDMERFIAWDTDFTGKEALLAIKDQDPDWEIVGFTLDEDDAFIPSRHYGGPGASVMLGSEIIGQVAKFVYSFVLEKNIGLLLIERGRVSKGDHITVHFIRDYDAVVTDRIFI